MDSERTDDQDQDNNVAQNNGDIEKEFESFAGYKITKRTEDKKWCLLEAEVKKDKGPPQKIEINEWNGIPQLKQMTYKPKLYLIFETKDPTSETLIDEIRQFSKKKKLPCHMIEQKLVFLGDNTSSVCTNRHTSDESIKKLVKKGCSIFQRGNTVKDECEISYFKRMTEAVIGEKVLPVIVSLSNGEQTEYTRENAKKLKIPVVQFKKNNSNVYELTNGNNVDLNTPWDARKPPSIHANNDHEDISSLSEIHCTMDLDLLICNLLIGVLMTGEDAIYGDDTEIYWNALSMYLLKIGKWQIPKNDVIRSFNHRSLEYIYEKELTTEFENGIWKDLKKLSGNAFIPPEASTTIKKSSRKDNAEIPDLNGESVALHTLHETSYEEKETILNASNHELYGLIFYALLQKQYFAGSKQLVETGYIHIKPILVGSSILKDAERNWKTTPVQKETLQRLNNAFTQRAITITQCIYDEESEKEEKKNHGTNNEHNEDVELELGYPVNHSGRLLLNHGYLEDAIKTENKTYIDNETVTKVLNKMWYGEEILSYRQIGCFILLALMHLFILPVLMVTMERQPLQWFYKKYNLPLMKVFLQLISYSALLMAFAYMLVFNLYGTLSYTDYFIICWMISLFLNETKQARVSVVRKRFKKYISDCWNILDWILILGFTIAFLLKSGANKNCLAASQILLVLIFILFCVRILNMFSWSAFVGPKLVMIRKMFKDTFGFIVIMTVIMISYNVSFHSLLYPNTDFKWSEIEKVMQNGYWTLFGENNVNSDALTEPDCTFNKTIYSSGALSRCPATIGMHIAPYLKAIYSLIAVTLLLNLLIAIYSDTFQQVQVQSKFHWSLLQKDFLEEYSLRTIFPIHLQLIALPVCLVHWLIWCIRNWSKCCSNEETNNFKKAYKLYCSPMFVRVFCYNTNYDQRLKSTELKETEATVKSKGVIDVIKEEKITVLQEQMEIKNIMMANKDELKMQLEIQAQRFEAQQKKNIKKIKEQLMTVKVRSKERTRGLGREEIGLGGISASRGNGEYAQMSRTSERLMRLMEEQMNKLCQMDERLHELYRIENDQQSHSAQVHQEQMKIQDIMRANQEKLKMQMEFQTERFEEQQERNQMILQKLVEMQEKQNGSDKSQQTME
ncbi:uncharacterized protein LOC134691350 isoform X2 [Mytilus trossulus]|uniref:uncharacterized protein LOC134691350 isoform X2 n=1 Tax=Mytilus trossulus TaxID=6551 RepID=UPI0030058573